LSSRGLSILTDLGEVSHTGLNNYGQFSDINSTYNTTNYYPILCSVTNVKKICIATSRSIRCMYYLTNDNKLYSAGKNDYGILGDGTTDDTNASGASLVQTDVKDALIIGGNDTMVTGLCLYSNAAVKAVGYGDRGQMGDGTSTSGNHPNWISVTYASNSAALTNITDIQACGHDAETTLYALNANGHLYGWGRNLYGELAQNDSSEKSRAVLITSKNITDFWACGTWTCNSVFVKEKNTNKIYACGRNVRSQLGISGTTSVIDELTEVTSLGSYNIKEIIMSDGWNDMGGTFAVTDQNIILVTGRNNWGQLGVGHTSDVTSGFVLCPGFHSQYTTRLKDGLDRDHPYVYPPTGYNVGSHSYILSKNNKIFFAGWGAHYIGSRTGERTYSFTPLSTI